MTAKNAAATFGARLKAARLRAGLTSDEAARRAGVTMPNYSAWENNRRVPDPVRQAAALALLAVHPAPPALAAILADYQRELAALAARYSARLLHALGDEPSVLLTGDALGRLDAFTDAPAAPQSPAARRARAPRSR